MFDFTDKKVLVTGGARGIGAATVAAFRAQGARVAVGARSCDSFDGFVARTGLDVAPAIGHVGDRAGAHAVVAAAVQALGGLDVLVNSAGVFAEVPVADVTEAHWHETISTNLGGTFFCCRRTARAGGEPRQHRQRGIRCRPHRLPPRHGVLRRQGRRGQFDACHGGGARAAHSRQLRLPGNVETDMILEAAAASGDPDAYLERARSRAHTRRMATPAEVAAAILYLASREASSTTGVALAVDGGGTAGF